MHRPVSVAFALMMAFSCWAHAETVQSPLQNCVPGTGPEQRQRCDDAVSQQLNASSQSTRLDEGWRLVRTRDPGGGADAVSVMRAADTAKSDINLAGLSLRCAQTGTEVELIVLEPQPRASHPKISLTAGANRAEFEASVTQSAQAIVLPQTASVFAAGAWQNSTELAVEIATRSSPIRGVVPLKGLARALSVLRASCPVR
jgi:hypothetical protein